MLLSNKRITQIKKATREMWKDGDLKPPENKPKAKVLLRGMPPKASLPVYRKRFWDRVQKNEGGCWVWLGAKAAHGYGQYSFDGQHVRAHRYAYFLTHGLACPSEEIHHTCGNHACVNPDHLEALSVKEHKKKHAKGY